MPTRILIADGREVLRQGLRTILGCDPDLAVVGEAADGIEAVRLAQALRPDLVVIDIALPGLDGIAATRAIRARLRNTAVIALADTLEDALVVDAVRAGAVGYLLKETGAEELRRAAKGAAAGQVQFSPRAVAPLVREVRAGENRGVLSARETEVLRSLTRGQANKEIARELGIAEKTVKTHVSSILGKLGVESRTQAALYAGRIGLVPIEQLGVSRPPGSRQRATA